MSKKFESYTVEDKGGDVMPFVVYGWGTYADDSLLAGQERKVFIETYATEGEARAAYPQCEAGTNGRSASSSVGHLPGEDDPVSGGMYPDDY